MRKITVGWMFPNLLNLHGERVSVQMLQRVGAELGLEVEICRIEDFDQRIPYGELDILVFLPGEISSFRYLVPALERQMNELTAFVEEGGYVLALGTTGLMFGREITREDGSRVKGLGLLDLTAKERKFVWGDDLYLKVLDSDMELIGSQIMMADVETSTPFAEVLYGRGNNKTGTDGARYRNLIYTNCTGPVLMKNPRFAEAILRQVSGEELTDISGCSLYKIARDSFHSTKKFIATKQSK